MRRLSSLLVLVAFASACSSTSMTNSSPASGSASLRSQAEPGFYRLMSDSRSLRDFNSAQLPYSFYVKGNLTGKGFDPVGNVEGKGKLCTDGKDWVSLNDGEYHAAASGTPQAPYVFGCKTRGGGFAPATREIVR